MRRVSTGFRRSCAMLALCTILSAHTASAASRGDGNGHGWRSAFERIKHIIVTVLDDVTAGSRLGLPPG